MKSPPRGEEEAGRFHGRFNLALSRILARLKVDDVPHIKRVIVSVVGGTVLILGVAMIITPVPGMILLIPLGLAILGSEYAWARLWLRKGRQIATKALSRTQRIVTRRGAEKGGIDATVPGANSASGAPQSVSETVDD